MKIPKFLKKKRNIWIIAIVIVVIFAGYLIFKPKTNTSGIQIGFATKQNLQETVLSTGQVVSVIDLALSFQSGGVVRRVSVKVGDKVYSGQVLASLDQSSALATLTSAQGALAQSRANYEKLLAGATDQSVKSAEDSVNLAKQDLKSAYIGGVNTLDDAYNKIFNAYSFTTYIQNTYFSSSDQQSVNVLESRTDINNNMKDIQKYIDAVDAGAQASDIESAMSKMIYVLGNVYEDMKTIRSQCEEGIYYTRVLTADKTSLDTQKAYINTASINVAALQSNLLSYKGALQKAEDQLSIVIAPPTQADIDLAKAQMLSAQGQVDSAEAIVNNSVISAPVSGTITQVDIKVGEQATPSKEVIVLQDVGDLHAEADVSEANIATLQVGQSIDYTFDALGPDKHFQGKVLSIDPSSTVISGVVNYKVKGSLDNVPGIKPGMTANMTILVAEKNDALAVPSTAVINKNNNQYIRVVDNSKTKTYHEVQVQTGLQADGGLIEIISGLNDGQEIIIYMKS